MAFWATDEDVKKLLEFVTRYHGSLKYHNHPKTNKRW